MIRLGLKRFLSLFLALMLVGLSTCTTCFATKGDNKKLQYMSRDEFFKNEREEPSSQELCFTSKEEKRIFVFTYNKMIRARGLHEKVEYVTSKFYVDDLLEICGFLESEQARQAFILEKWISLDYAIQTIQEVASYNEKRLLAIIENL